MATTTPIDPVELQKQEHSRLLEEHYITHLRPHVLQEHRGKWIVMRSINEYTFMKDEDMDRVFGEQWSYWDSYGGYFDVIGQEQRYLTTRIGMY